MLTRGLRIIVVAACGLGVAGGCQVPPLPSSAQTRPQGNGGSDPYEGWLLRKLTGQEQSGAQQNAPPGTPSAPPQNPPPGVQPASAMVPAGLPPGSDPAVQNLGTSLATAAAAKNQQQEPNDKDSGFDWSDLDPQNVYKNLKAAAGYGPNEPLAQSLYKEGEALFRQKRYQEAAAKFKAAADRWPDSTLEEDALFFEAESYFFSDQYSKAHDTFQNLFKKHQNSRYLDTAAAREFAIGRYWEQTDKARPQWPITPNLTDNTRPLFDTFGNALSAYQSVRMNDPTGPLADDSLMATANAYFIKGRYEDAAYHYDLLRKEYPKSEHQLQAHLLGLEAKKRVYQGPLYDGAPLSDADEIAQQTLTQFRNQLGDEQQRVAQTKAAIREEKAQRDWAIAQFYEKKNAFGAARIYYQAIIDQHPGTRFAQMAQQRLEQIKNEPDKPPNRFKWLTGLFPSEK